MSQPPYNPQGPPYPQQSGGNVGFEQYQQGAPPPPYSAGPAPYPQQQYQGQPSGPYAPGPYGPSGPGPYGASANYPAGQQPQTVYVYEERRGRQKQDEDTCLAVLAGACAMCLCCSLLSD